MSNYKRGRILITGATGFLGANMTRRLVAKGKDVHIFVRKGSDTWRIHGILPSITVHKVDLADERAVKLAVEKIKPGVVYHLAAHGLFLKQDYAEQMVGSNIQGTVHLLEALRSAGSATSIINVGSFAEYDPEETHITEASVLEPRNAYGVSKASQSFFAQYYARMHKLPIAILRPTVVYGSYEESRRLIPGVILAHIRNETLQLSSPHPRKDFLYVEDALDAFEAAAARELAPGEVINIGLGAEYSIRDAVGIIQKLTGKKVALEWGALEKRPWDSAKKHTFRIDKAKELLGWQPKHAFEQGIEKTIAWFEAHNHLYVQL